jgi:hypothetical protein
MNLILFLTIIVLILFFAYSAIFFKYKEHFRLEIDDSGYFEDPNNKQYNQLKEFISDSDEYTVKNDTGIMIDIDKPISLQAVEFNNLKERLNYYRNIELEQRAGDKVSEIKKGMILDQDANEVNYPVVRKELSLLKLDSIVSDLLKRHEFTEKLFRDRIASYNSHSNTESYGQRINNNIRVPPLDLKMDTTLKIPAETLESYRFITNWILEQISAESLKELYNIKYVNTVRFKFKYDKVIRHYVDYDNNLERFEFQAMLYRDNKEHNFYMYFDIIFDTKYIRYYINEMIILGINIEQLLLFGDYLDKDYKLDSNGKHLSLSNENPGYVTDNYINTYRQITADFVKADVESRKKHNNETLDNGFCFFKDAPDKDTCISYTPEGGVGIWDTPCKYNEECPFYKKNGNYPNSRGGCIGGYCEMPVNVGLLGFKEYNEADISRAICYNCEATPGCSGIGCSQCCEEQLSGTVKKQQNEMAEEQLKESAENQKLYANLITPDYAFSNDYFERIKYMKEFAKKDMAPIKIVV